MSYLEFSGVVKPDPRGHHSKRNLKEVVAAYSRTNLDTVSLMMSSGTLIASKPRLHEEYASSVKHVSKIFAELAYLIRVASEQGIQMIVKGEFKAEYDNELDGSIEVISAFIDSGKLFAVKHKYNRFGRLVREGRPMEVRPSGTRREGSLIVKEKRKIFPR